MAWTIEGMPRYPFGLSEPPNKVTLVNGAGERRVYAPENVVATYYEFEHCPKCQAKVDSERIEQLENLVRDLWQFVSKADRLQWPELGEHMAELGIETW